MCHIVSIFPMKKGVFVLWIPLRPPVLSLKNEQKSVPSIKPYSHIRGIDTGPPPAYAWKYILHLSVIVLISLQWIFNVQFYVTYFGLTSVSCWKINAHRRMVSPPCLKATPVPDIFQDKSRNNRARYFAT